MNSRNGFLSNLLQLLVNEWGYEQVAKALSRKDPYSSDPADESRVSPRNRSSPGKAMLSPTEQIERALLDPARKELLLQLAKRYEQKQFLPNVAAVREFLVMMGHNAVNMKDRTQAFRVLLRSLLQLPTERLQQITNSSLHSGPSQLGPISDAIAAAGEHLPRRSKEAATLAPEHDEQKI